MPSGSSVDIIVVAGGMPIDFMYQWFRNGMVIPGETGSTLSIRNINTTDIGVYNCTPSNSRGTTNSSNTTISVSCKSSLLTVFSSLICIVYIASLQLNGLIPNTIPNFAPAVSSGYTISPSNPKIRLTSSGELVTDQLGPEDSGTYTFTSADLGGAILSISVSSEYITVFHCLISYFIPLVSTPPSTIEGLFGRRIVIPCDGNTVGAMRYEWWKDGARLLRENASELVLLNASYDHVGFYHCIAFHSNSVFALSKIQLNIKGQDKI